MRILLRATLAIAVLSGGRAMAAGADQAAPQSPSNEDCLACHNDKDVKRADNTSIFVDPAAFGASKHGAMNCVDCHADLAALTEFPHPDKLARVACHGMHNIQRSDDPSSPTSHLNLPQTCAKCHGNASIIKQANIAIGNVAA